MRMQFIDTLALKCPQPVHKIAEKVADMIPGDILEVLGDCPTFERDVRTWCEQLGKFLLSVKDEGNDQKRIWIQL